MRRTHVLAATATVVLATALPTAWMAGCASYDDGDITVACGDFNTFPAVSGVLEKRCGTLDCHGSLARPLRIYGRQGLRRPIKFAAAEGGDPFNAKLAEEIDAGADQYFPNGDQPTTPTELLENYRSVCGLEPELTTLVVQGKEKPEVLTLIRKARLVEKHKGGKIFTAGSEGDACLTSWLSTPAGADGSVFNPAPCTNELKRF